MAAGSLLAFIALFAAVAIAWFTTRAAYGPCVTSRHTRHRPSAFVHEPRHECVDLTDDFARIADEQVMCA
jgi:hypothetical protein